jgi:ribosomal protein S18 acetylase RimI-like enzyme
VERWHARGYRPTDGGYLNLTRTLDDLTDLGARDDRVPTRGRRTFEPVATHPDLQRRGHGRTLLREGARRFAEAGMTYAIIGVALDGPGAEALYRSVGLRLDRVLRVYERA